MLVSKWRTLPAPAMPAMPNAAPESVYKVPHVQWPRSLARDTTPRASHVPLTMPINSASPELKTIVAFVVVVALTFDVCVDKLKLKLFGDIFTELYIASSR